jgi:hypothetical protein
MRLVTFENPLRQRRAGALASGDRIVDLNLASAARYASEGSAAYRRADALLPSDTRLLFEGGDNSLEAAREAFTCAMAEGEALRSHIPP